MTKIVVNKCYGGFNLSHEGVKLYAKYAGFSVYPHRYDSSNEFQMIPVSESEAKSGLFIFYTKAPVDEISESEEDNYDFDVRGIKRDDPILVRVVEELGERAGGRSSKLKIVDIPDDVSWQIEEYDGLEHVAKAHRTW